MLQVFTQGCLFLGSLNINVRSAHLQSCWKAACYTVCSCSSFGERLSHLHHISHFLDIETSCVAAESWDMKTCCPASSSPSLTLRQRDYRYSCWVEDNNVRWFSHRQTRTSYLPVILCWGSDPWWHNCRPSSSSRLYLTAYFHPDTQSHGYLIGCLSRKQRVNSPNNSRHTALFKCK